MIGRAGLIAAGAALLAMGGTAAAQPLDLGKGGPIEITAHDGIDLHQNEQVVIARGDARATRGDVTVTADRLIAHYRKKSTGPNAQAAQATPVAAKAPGTPATPDTPDASGNEVFRLEADGNVHIFTATDQAVGDHATYDIDQAVLALTGQHMKLTTPQDVLTARDSLEYWPQKHIAVGRGNAVVVTDDGRRLSADTMVGYTADPNAPGKPAPPKPAVTADAGKPPADPVMASGKLQKVEAFGNVEVRTATETVRGDRGVYVPDTGIARLAGHVRITRGENQMNGAEADVNMKTGIAVLTNPGGRVEGLVVPNDASSQPAANGAPAPPKPAPAKTP